MNLRPPRLQFSLRTLVIGMVIVAALASWHGSRYARYQARIAALIEGEKRGLLFFPRETANRDYSNPTFEAPRPSLAERWEMFCFGADVGRKFPYLKMTLSAEACEQRTKHETYYQEILQHFPEIEIIDVRLPNTNDSQGIVWTSAGNPKQESSDVAAAVCDFAANPLSYQFHAYKPAMIGDAWVAALPDGCSLTHLKCSLCLSPNGTLELLRKAPQLREFWLNFTGKNAQVDNALADRFSLTFKASDHYIVRAKR